MASDQKNQVEIPDRTVVSYYPTGRLLEEFGTRIWRVLIYSSAYLAVIAAAKVLIVQYALSLPSSPAPVIGGLITFAVYANDRLVDLEDDELSNPRRTAFVRRNRTVMYVLAALAYGIGAALSALGGPAAFGLSLVPGLVWLGYARDWIPSTNVRFDRLKEVLLLNTTLVATAWALGVVFLPVAFANAPITPAVIVLFVYFFLGTFVNTEIANVRDIETDDRGGVATLPSLLGIPRTRRVLSGITLLAGTVLGLAAVLGVLGLAIATVLSIGLVVLLGIVFLLGRSENRNLLMIAAECSRLPVLAGLVLVV